MLSIFGVISMKMMGNIETRDYLAEGDSVKSKKQRTQDRNLGDHIRDCEGI